MARFNMSGLDDIIHQVTRLGEAGSEVGDEMLLAGAEEVKKARRKAAEEHGLRDTGDMIDSMGYARTPKDIGGIKTVDIYSQGKDRKGVRNAEKEFVLHYGSSRIKATHWVDDAEAIAAEPAQAAMEQVFDQHLKEKGMI